MVNSLTKLSDDLQKNNLLEKLSKTFKAYYNVIPRFGVELEFYLSENIDIERFKHLMSIDVKKERGINQYEIVVAPSSDLTNYAFQITALKQKIKDISEELAGVANLAAKPFINDYGNSIHFNLSIGNKIDLLTEAARNLCHYMLDTYYIFMPEKEDYLRSIAGFLAPTHVCYGGNNRTVAIRIPNSFPLRLEHRLSSPNVDPYLAMTTILHSILLGLQSARTTDSFSKIYGNAYDTQYKLMKLPSSIEQAISLFKINFFEKELY